MGGSLSLPKLIILRGLPGSGKAEYAKHLTKNGGVILSSEDYFKDENGVYTYDRKKLKDSHILNQKRAADAIESGEQFIVIANTNVRKWEEKPYVKVGVLYGYDIYFIEPPKSWWAHDLEELMARDDKNVPKKTMEKMLNEWEDDFTVVNVLNSRAPWERYHTGIKERGLETSTPTFDDISNEMEAAYAYE